MLDWIVQNVWLLWLVLFLVLAAVEMITLDLMFLMLSVGALAALAASFVTGSFFIQCIVFCIVALAMILFVRPVALRHLKKGPPEQRSNIDRLIGEMALTLEPVSAASGIVKIGGDTWSARVASEGEIPAGRKVSVTRIEGATAIVTAVSDTTASGP
ncbi:NfeD family protein [Arthrobacter castelli]|uniref:NfeD family protein n=1 Tax=Arthrobacter castelli TaxID=271431 RepID=UPI000426F8C8|nr:NfeD family protein [Arthrobacter castelli]